MTIARTATQSAARPLRASNGFTVLRHWMAVRHQRRALARLDQHLLTDIGCTREEAALEARRAAWDVPQSWRFGG